MEKRLQENAYDVDAWNTLIREAQVFQKCTAYLRLYMYLAL